MFREKYPCVFAAACSMCCCAIRIGVTHRKAMVGDMKQQLVLLDRYPCVLGAGSSARWSAIRIGQGPLIWHPYAYPIRFILKHAAASSCGFNGLLSASMHSRLGRMLPQTLLMTAALSEEARKLTSSREILLWMTPSEAPKALQASECSELLDPMRASCWIFAQH